jgi:hypothetical protein
MKQLRTLHRRRSAHLGALFASVLSLAGCAMPAGHLGEGRSPIDAQASMTTNDANQYPAVHDMPPERTQPLMSSGEQARIRGELSAARGRQAPTAAARKR